MPVYYHIHRSILPIKLDKTKIMFMAKKNTFWNIAEKKIAGNHFLEYKINIPASRFTESLHPKDKSKIFRITKENSRAFFKKYPYRSGLDDFGGIDASDYHYRGKQQPRWNQELVLKDWKDVTIELLN